MRKKFLNRFILMVLILATFVFVSIRISEAANVSITPEPWPENSSATFCLGSFIPSGADAINADDFLDFKFASGFDLTNVTISDTTTESEVEVYWGSYDCTGTPRITETTLTADNDRDYAYITGQTLRFILEDQIPSASTYVSFKVVDKTDANTSAIVSPAAGKYLLSLEWGPSNGDTTYIPKKVEADFIYVGDTMPDQVDISASIDPTISLNLSSTSCAIGTMSASTIETCSYTATVQTNATGGYVGFLQSDAGFVSGSNEINSVSDAAVSVSTEEYGVGVDTTDIVGNFHDYSSVDTCSNLDGGTTEVPAYNLDNTAQTFASSTSSVDGSSTGVTTFCHAAAITATTPAGAYTQTVTVTVVGNF